MASLLAIRRHEFNPIFHSGKLFQQFLLDIAIQVEQNNLNFIIMNQSKFLKAKKS